MGVVDDGSNNNKNFHPLGLGKEVLESHQRNPFPGPKG
jgi:hypothetical protein